MTQSSATGITRPDTDLPPTQTRRSTLRTWRLRLGGQRSEVPDAALPLLSEGIDVEVPESVLGALVRLELVPDVTVDGHEEHVAWPAESSWVYETTVGKTGSGGNVRLVLEGVDTLGTVRVDGQAVLLTDDMFHRWVVDLGVDDGPGAWHVEVDLEPALPVARAAEAVRPLPRADVYDLPFNQVRKMACSFGWDWGPTTLTSGLWRRTVVERLGDGHIERALLSGHWEEGAVLGMSVTTGGTVAAVRLRICDAAGFTVLQRVLMATDGAVSATIPVPDARPWNVVGRGDQPLYHVDIEALDGAGFVLDTERRRIGFRDARLRQRPDGGGHSFEFVVNGDRIWVRGFNWIPAHVLPEAVGRSHVRELVKEAVAAGANLLRVWGGGVVESDDFYDVCDELGVLVWQDFSFACAAYPEGEGQSKRVRREVEDAVLRIGYRTSLALWCGNNENLWGHEDWGWIDALGDEPWGAGLYFDLIPGVLADLDPGRQYVPGSPFSPDPQAHPNDPTQGTTHHWDTWNELDYTAFEEKRSRFASEFGWQAPASWPTLTRALGGPPTGGNDERLQRLQKASQGMEKLERGVKEHLAHLPSDGRGWYLATQLVQARALRTSISQFRSQHESCSGALWWQLDDCWPALSWSVLDVRGHRKLAWWAAGEVMSARAVLPLADGVPNGLTLVNDLPEAWAASGVLRVLTATGQTLHAQSIDVQVPGDRYVVVRPRVLPAQAAMVVVDLEGRRAVRWLRHDAELPISPSQIILRRAVVRAEVVVLDVEAVDLVRDLVLLTETHPDLEDARVDRQLTLVLPGEKVRLTVSGPGVDGVTIEEWAELLGAGTELSVSCSFD